MSFKAFTLFKGWGYIWFEGFWVYEFTTFSLFWIVNFWFVGSNFFGSILLEPLSINRMRIGATRFTSFPNLKFMSFLSYVRPRYLYAIRFLLCSTRSTFIASRVGSRRGRFALSTIANGSSNGMQSFGSFHECSICKVNDSNTCPIRQRFVRYTDMSIIPLCFSYGHWVGNSIRPQFDRIHRGRSACGTLNMRILLDRVQMFADDFRIYFLSFHVSI